MVYLLKLIGQIGPLVIGIILIAMLIPNTRMVSRGALVFATSPEPSLRQGFFLGVLLLGLLLIVIFKRGVLRRASSPKS